MREAAGASAAIMPFTSLSAIAANTIGICFAPVSCRYDASAAAPAGLWAASISNSPSGLRLAGASLRDRPSLRRGTRSHSSRAGHSQSVSPVTIASVETWPTSVDHRSRIDTATAAFSS